MRKLLPMPNRLTIDAERLDNAARDHGIKSDAGLAKRLGVAKSTLSRVKSGSLEPGPTVVAGLLVCFPGDAAHILRVVKTRAKKASGKRPPK